ncbi:MAG: preprotein translocase subunit SecE [Buchnera aphidicola (Floraphis choui)]
MANIIKFWNNPRTIDIIKWFSIGILVMSALIHYYYIHLSFILHIIITISLMTLIITITALTKKGKKIISLIHEAKKEIKKITWPSMKETFHTTIIVIIATFIMSLTLWGLDNILIRFVSFVISLRI